MASDVQPGPETTNLVIRTGVSPHEKVGFPIQDCGAATSTRSFEMKREQHEEEHGDDVTDNKDLNSNAQKNSSDTAQLKISPLTTSMRPPRKRRHSTSLPPPSDHSNTVPKFSSPQQVRKRRRTAAGSFQNMKFLLGGNISDPLNLNSLVTGDPNAPIVSPYCSPAPSRNKDSVPVIIPQDITDPLNLKCGEGDDSVLIVPSFTEPSKIGTKRKKRHFSHRRKTDAQKKDGSSDFTSDSSEIEKSDQNEREVPTHLELNKQNNRQDQVQTQRADKIVSPVLDAFDDTSPRGRQRKRKLDPSSKVSRSLLRTDSLQPKEDQQAPKHVRRQTSNEQKILPKHKGREREKLFKYGNYNQYYGKRIVESERDERLRCFSRDWFKNKDVLDIGCNIGHVTITVARDFEPNRIMGIDIDGNLISIARKNVRHYLSPSRSFLGEKFPVSADRCQGPISAPPIQRSGTDQSSRFPHNVSFKCCNYVLEKDDLLALQKPEYDVILCLSVTKWIHLNWGDAGMKRMFKRMYRQLRPGGRLILEPQSWQSYAKKKKLTETIRRNYDAIRLKPEQFTEYLLSKEVGFTTCEMLDTPVHQAKGFRRPILMFRKSHKARSQTESNTSQHNAANKHEIHRQTREHHLESKKDEKHKDHHSDVKKGEKDKEHHSVLKKDEKHKDHHSDVKKGEKDKEHRSELKKDEKHKDHHSDVKKGEKDKEHRSELKKDEKHKDHHSDVKREKDKEHRSELKKDERHREHHSEVKKGDKDKEHHSVLKKDEKHKEYHLEMKRVNKEKEMMCEQKTKTKTNDKELPQTEMKECS
ncbi:7SK snRNA methylphosphate capping enzyme-like [Glandiceps talaboti]